MYRLQSHGYQIKSPTRRADRPPEVPPEIWGVIAFFSSRQSLSRLCAVSRGFYRIFVQELYSTIIATSSEASQLIETLNDSSSSLSCQHLRSLIQSLNLELAFDYKENLHTLNSALKMLSSSPLLHTLRLALSIFFSPTYNTTPTAKESFDMISSLNRTQFPTLRAFDIAIRYQYPQFEMTYMGVADLAPFLAAHPDLLHLKLAVQGTEFSGEDAAFLPQLRSFTGFLRNGAALCDSGPQRPLEKLSITVATTAMLHQPEIDFGRFPSVIHPSLKSLHIRAIDQYQYTTFKSCDNLSPTYLHCVVSSFPNVTHLDIPLSYDDVLGIFVHGPALSALVYLEHLRVEQHRRPNEEDPTAERFPPGHYLSFISSLLPNLSSLVNVDITVLENNDMFSDDAFYYMIGVDTDPVDYHFSINRVSGKAEALLVQSEGD
ncbi:hypothetical protein C8J57DRAFT_1417465 [Mycena rebaudengoi]|nr:hypothetical protein C8J57DRAFT_1417465 [Mycena rebaudengoi]